MAGLASVAMTEDVDALAEALKAKSMEGTLARHTAEFACSLLAMAKAHERPGAPGPRQRGRDAGGRAQVLAVGIQRILFDAGRPGAKRKPSTLEAMTLRSLHRGPSSVWT